ncbi:MAG TPA: methyltransferase domain-containing protein [Rhizomicrobium sp.]|nr:methyltransferase domain-containing protein [Rhizomicrobium sp.]
MPQTVRDLAAFYDAPLGQLARRAIAREIHALWPDLRNYRVLGYGFAIPYLSAFSGTERCIAAMPAPVGVVGWPEEKNAALLCEEDALPFPDVFFDRILIVHGLESAESLRPLLRQLWRVLAPEGRILLVAPNRASLWAQVQKSPFGHGRPFSRMELESLLKDALFEPGRWRRALYAPPFETVTRSGTGWEKVGSRLFSRIGGVHVVEAAKSLYAAATPAVPKGAKVALKAAEDF